MPGLEKFPTVKKSPVLAPMDKKVRVVPGTNPSTTGDPGFGRVVRSPFIPVTRGLPRPGPRDSPRVRIVSKPVLVRPKKVRISRLS